MSSNLHVKKMTELQSADPVTDGQHPASAAAFICSLLDGTEHRVSVIDVLEVKHGGREG